MAAKLKCAIIGAGIVGASAAHTLANRGADVTLFEQFEFLHDRGSSHGPTRLIRLAYFEHPDYVPLLRSCVAAWRNWEKEADEQLFYEIGIFMLGAPNGNLIAGVRRAASEYDVAIAELTRKDAAGRYTQFHQPDGYDAIFEPEAGFLRADRTLNYLLEKTKDIGGRLCPRTSVIEWIASDKGVEIVTASGRQMFDRLVIAPGAWGNDLLKLEGVSIKPLRKTVFWITPDDNAYALEGGFPPFAIDRKDGRFFYGFPAIDQDGVKLGEHTGGATLKTANDAAPPPADEADGVKEFLREFIPGAPQEFSQDKQCLYEMSRDGHFIMDTHPADPRVTFAAGLSGHGFKFAPVIGDALADLAINGETKKEFDFLGVGRFKKMKGGS